MKSDFYNESLKNLSEYISRGITPSYTEGNGIQVLNQKCVRDGKISIEASRLHDNEQKKVSDEKILKKNDILVNSTGLGTLGRVAQKHDDTIATVDSHITIVRPKKSKVDPLFLGYLLKQNQSLIESLAEGSTGQTELSRIQLGELRFDLPVDKKFQRSIGEAMYLLDSKIEYNHKINQTLESISQTLFKSWFIDFDPVKAKIVAKEQGEDPQLAAMMAISGKSEDEINQMPADKRKQLVETADLFPDEMVESELGQIPKGWKIEKIENVIEVVKHKKRIKNSDYLKSGKFPIIDQGKEYVSGYTDEVGSVQHSEMIVFGDHTRIIKYVNFPFVAGADGTKLLTSKPMTSTLIYLHNLLVFNPISDYKYERHFKYLLDVKFCLPDYKTLVSFEKINIDLYKFKTKIFIENNYFHTIRDALLPKLLSGELSL